MQDETTAERSEDAPPEEGAETEAASGEGAEESPREEASQAVEEVTEAASEPKTEQAEEQPEQEDAPGAAGEEVTAAEEPETESFLEAAAALQSKSGAPSGPAEAQGEAALEGPLAAIAPEGGEEEAEGSEEEEEGCLSIPNVFGPVTRSETIQVQAYNLEGQEIVGELCGLPARVVQHEIDHLNGTLFIDRLTPTAKMAINEALEEFEIEFRSKRESGTLPDDATIAARLAELENLWT